jgi:predicted amidohydrolase YtcJ
MIVLPGNLLATPAEELMAVEVQQTYLQGELVYQRTAKGAQTQQEP